MPGNTPAFFVYHEKAITILLVVNQSNYDLRSYEENT